MTKYIFVTGGVVSGLGKGIKPASVDFFAFASERAGSIPISSCSSHSYI